MPSLLALDYGRKRVGVAVTDPLQLIATPLQTLPASRIIEWLSTYLATTPVAAIAVGMPFHLDGRRSLMAVATHHFARRLQYRFPDIPIFEEDERFTSSIAAKSMVEGGLCKKKRQAPGYLDKISATIILQSFMERYKAGSASPLHPPTLCKSR